MADPSYTSSPQSPPTRIPIFSLLAVAHRAPLVRSMETHAKDNELSAAQIVRERESYRYLNTSHIHAYVDRPDQDLPSARPCTDGALVAFSQLGLLRLNAQRAFVCLLDRKYCYTIAETTALSKLRLNGSRNAKHGLVSCGTATRHAFSLPSLILEAAVEGLLSAGESNTLPLPVLAIPDLREDGRFSSVPAVTRDDSSRSCIGVPIKSYSGAFIGVFCVLDRQPRVTLSDVDRDFLCDLSRTIMDHLELCRSRRELGRSTRMVRGLGSFVEDRATISGLSGESQRRASEGKRGREGILNTQQQETLRKMEKEEAGQHTPASGSGLGSTTVAKDWGDQTQAHSQTRHLSQTEPSIKRLPTSSIESWISQGKNVAEVSPPPENERSQEDDGAVSTSNPPTQATTTSPLPADDVQQLFSRAANIIRESIEVEGVLFFDASVGYWGGLLESARRNSSEGGSSTTSFTSSSGDDDSQPSRSTIRTHADEANCEVFGFSMTDGSSIDGKKATASHLTVPERFLRILLRRYPAGKIFNFTADGRHVSDTETDEDFQYQPASGEDAQEQEAPPRIHRKRYNYSRANEAALIIRVFPGARSVLAFPLWDSHRERWFAGGVAWTRTPTRVFSIKGELSYLRAFGMVVMAEVARMDAQAANKSKTTLLSSISHELRSPLQGILGGVEILQGTEIDVFQNNVIHTVEVCGVMLLDTIEHLLTQSEINQSVRMAKLRRRERRKHSQPNNANMQGLDTTDGPYNVEIDAIVEEVVGTMFAGHEFKHSRPTPKPTAESAKSLSVVPHVLPNEQDISPKSIQENVKVILDIKPSASWTYDLEAGALRRVVMNIFGNALKYTTAGHIKVTVTQRKLLKKRPAEVSEIKITVEDTGKGISKEFLSNHLFKPFSQEDPLSQGTGLGLSITHQIVATLDGKIDVQSTVGRGTVMSVFLRLTPPDVVEDTPAKLLFLTQARRAKGLRVALFGFHDAGTPSETEPNKANTDWQLPRDAVAMLCRDWLQMDVLADSEACIRPDVYIATQAGGQELAAMNQAGTVVQPVIVICPTAAIAQGLTRSSKTLDKFGVIEYISQPCGPRKLVKTLTLCLDRWADIQVEQAIQEQSTLPTHIPSTAFTPLQTEPFLSLSDGPSLVLPSLHTERQNPEYQDSLPSESPKSVSHNPNVSNTGGLITAAETAPFLIVDDNHVNLKMLAAYIGRKSYPFTTAVDGLLAIEAYKATRGNFSCIFMDIQMPHMDGISATRAIREYERKERLKAVTVVAMTGLVTEEKQKEAEASGIDEFFAKPVRLKALDRILERTARAPDA